MKDLIVCCGMRRAASTLLYCLVREVAKIKKYNDIGWTHVQELDTTLGSAPYTSNLVRVHAYAPKHSPVCSYLFSKRRAFAFYSRRDLRDVMASMKRYSPKQLEISEQFTHNLLSVIETDEEWSGLDHHQIKIFDYRYLRDDTTSAVYDILKIMDVSASRAMVDDIVSKYSIEENRKRMGDGLFWNRHIDKGADGIYKELLTPQEIEVVEYIAGDWLIEHGYMEA